MKPAKKSTTSKTSSSKPVGATGASSQSQRQPGGPVSKYQVHSAVSSQHCTALDAPRRAEKSVRLVLRANTNLPADPHSNGALALGARG